MSTQPEGNFIRKVHKLLPSTVYAEKMHNAYRGGTPDCYYEGAIGSMWIEYKWLPKLPARHTLMLTPLQLRWLRRNAANGKYPWVVLGWKEGTKTECCIFLHSDWEKEHTQEQLRDKAIPPQALAYRITNRCAN